MAWAWPNPVSFDEKFPSGSAGTEYAPGEFDLTQWKNGYYINNYYDSSVPASWNGDAGKLYPGVPGYGTISHKKSYLFDEDWFELGIDIPHGHYSLTVEDFDWGEGAGSQGGIDHFGIVANFHDAPLFVNEGAGTAYFTYNGEAFTDLYAYVAGETISKANYKITFNQINNYQPKINSIPTEVANEDVQWSYALDVTDLNNDSLSFVINKPEWIYWDEQSRTLFGTPKQTDIGSASISITVSDGWGGNAIQKFDLAVSSVNDEPFIDNIYIKGDFIAGQGVELDLDALVDEDGLGNPQIQWQSDGNEIKDATGSELYISDDLVGTIISARVNYRDGFGTLEEFQVNGNTEVAPRPGDIIRPDRVIGSEINPPSITEKNQVYIGERRADKYFRTTSLADGKSVIIMADGDDVSLLIVNSSTGTLISKLDKINDPFEHGSRTVDPSFKGYGWWMSEDIDVKPLGQDMFIAVWTGNDGVGVSDKIYGRIFTNDGEAVSDSFYASYRWNDDNLSPSLIPHPSGDGFSVAFFVRYPQSLYIEHFSVDQDGTVSLTGRDEGLIPGGLIGLFGINVTMIGTDQYLVSAVGRDGGQHYHDVATWRLLGQKGGLTNDVTVWLTDNSQDMKATESITLGNGDVVVTYYGGNYNAGRSGVNAQIIRTDGSISDPIFVGRADLEHSHQPFALGNDSWGVAWAGVVDSGESISNVAFYNNDGEKIGSFHDQQKNYLIQGSSDELGNILLTSFETSGGSADLNTKVVNLDPLSLGLFEGKIIVGSGEARVEISSISLPESAPYLSGTIEWSVDGKLIATLPANESLSLGKEIIGKSLTAKVNAFNSLGSSSIFEIESNQIIEALDTINFIPLLSEQEPESVFGIPETLDYFNSIQGLTANHNAGIYTFFHEGKQKFIIPDQDISKVKQGDFGYPETNDLIKLDNGGYLISYQSGNKIYVSELNADLIPIESPILVTPSHLTSTTFSDPFFVFDGVNPNPSGVGYHFSGASWDNTIYKAVMPIGSDYHPTASFYQRPFQNFVTASGSDVKNDVPTDQRGLSGEITRFSLDKNLYTDGEYIFFYI